MAKKHVRIMSWNVQWGRGADCRVDWARTIAVIRAVAPDVVVLQEVAQHYPELPDNDDADQVAILHAAFPEWATAYAPGIDEERHDGRRKRFGNWLGSRWPITCWRSVALPTPPATHPKWFPRTALVATLSVAGRSLTVVGTHLEYYCARQRLAQVGALNGFLAVSPPRAARDSLVTPPAVLVGDLNFPPQSPEYRALAEGGAWRDVWPLRYPNQPHAPTVGLHGAPWPDRPYCCDYAWVTTDLMPEVVAFEVLAETAASDHQPIVLTLNWSDGG